MYSTTVKFVSEEEWNKKEDKDTVKGLLPTTEPTQKKEITVRFVSEQEWKDGSVG